MAHPPGHSPIVETENPVQESHETAKDPGHIDVDEDVNDALEQFGDLITRAKDTAAAFGFPQVFFGVGGAAGEKGEKGEKGTEDAKRKLLGSDDRLTAADLRKLAGTSFTSEDQRKAFLGDMETFEKRAEKGKMSTDQREQFYAQVGRMLQNADAGGNKRFDAAGMRSLAGDVMRHGGRPGTVNQGGYPTCVPAALESILYKEEPATIARLVADVTIDGSYKTVDGSIITPPERNLKPDKYNDDKPEKKRSGADQVAQIALLNIFWNRQDGFEEDQTGKKGKIFYEEGHPKDNIGDAQVRLMDRSTNPPKPIMVSYGEVDPTNENSGALASADKPLDQPGMSIGRGGDIYKQLRGNTGNIMMISAFKDKLNESPETLAEFQKLFEKAAAGGEDGRGIPILLGVFANFEPFKSDLAKLAKGEKLSKEAEERLSQMHEHHAVASFHYDPKTKLATVENQWSEENDHTGEPGSKPKIHIDDLFKAYKGEAEKPAVDKPAVERKKPTGDQFIAQQKKFVDELAADSDVAPDKLLRERLVLHKYVQHWKGEEAARPIVKDLAKDLTRVLQSGSGDFDSQARRLRDILPMMQKAGMDKDVSATLATMDKSFLTRMAKSEGGFTLPREAAELVKLHTEFGDKAGGAKLVDEFTTRLQESRKNDPQNRFRWASQLAIEELQTLGFGDAAKKIHGQLTDENRKLEKEKGDTNADAISGKLFLLNTAQKTGDKETAAKLMKELEATYDKLRDDPKIPERTIGDLQVELRDHYLETKNKAKLERVGNEIIERIAASYDDGVKGSGMNHRHMMGPLRMQASIFAKADLNDQAVAMMEKAYALMRKAGKDDYGEDKVAPAMAALYRKVGRTADAERVEKESKVEKPRRGRWE